MTGRCGFTIWNTEMSHQMKPCHEELVTGTVLYLLGFYWLPLVVAIPRKFNVTLSTRQAIFQGWIFMLLRPDLCPVHGDRRCAKLCSCTEGPGSISQCHAHVSKISSSQSTELLIGWKKLGCMARCMRIIIIKYVAIWSFVILTRIHSNCVSQSA